METFKKNLNYIINGFKTCKQHSGKFFKFFFDIFMKVIRIAAKVLYYVGKTVSVIIWISVVCNAVNMISPNFWIEMAQTRKVFGAPVRFLYNVILYDHPKAQYVYVMLKTKGVWLAILSSFVCRIMAGIIRRINQAEYNYYMKKKAKNQMEMSEVQLQMQAQSKQQQSQQLTSLQNEVSATKESLYEAQLENERLKNEILRNQIAQLQNTVNQQNVNQDNIT